MESNEIVVCSGTLTLVKLSWASWKASGCIARRSVSETVSRLTKIVRLALFPPSTPVSRTGLPPNGARFSVMSSAEPSDSTLGSKWSTMSNPRSVPPPSDPLTPETFRSTRMVCPIDVIADGAA